MFVRPAAYTSKAVRSRRRWLSDTLIFLDDEMELSE